MSVKDILTKLKDVDGIDEDILKELKELDKPKEDKGLEKELKEAKAAQARILEEKKKAAEKAAELEAQIEDLKSGGLSEVEKAQKELEKAQKAKEKLEADLAGLKADSEKRERNYKLDKISSKIKFLDTVPEDMRNYAVSNAFKDVEDLDDNDAVNDIIEGFKESHKGVLATESAARGSGSSENEKITVSTKSPDKMSVDERAKHLRDQARERSLIGTVRQS